VKISYIRFNVHRYQIRSVGLSRPNVYIFEVIFEFDLLYSHCVIIIDLYTLDIHLHCVLRSDAHSYICKSQVSFTRSTTKTLSSLSSTSSYLQLIPTSSTFTLSAIPMISLGALEPRRNLTQQAQQRLRVTAMST